MTHDEMIAVIEHHKKGGRLEMRLRHDVSGLPGEWKDAQPVHIKWDFDTFDYRIKPEPVELWAVEWQTGDVTTYKTEARAAGALEFSGAVRMFKMREVED